MLSRVGVSFAFLAAAACCAVISFHVLFNNHDKKAGIITFNVRRFSISLRSVAVSLLVLIRQFNFANVHQPASPLVSLRAASGRGITPPVPTEFLSVTSDAATAVSSVVSQLQSVASVAATAIPSADAIVPRNISFGTKQFCVGFSNRLECNDLPVNTSKILPQALTSTVGALIEDFHRLDGTLSRLSIGYIRDSFIVGLATATFTAVVFVCSTFGQYFGIVPHLQDLSLMIMLKLAIPVICCVSFLIPTVIVYTLYSKSEGLQSSIKVNKGDVGGYCLGGFFSAVVMTVLTPFTDIFGNCAA
jgi:hypothetical protein